MWIKAPKKLLSRPYLFKINCSYIWGRKPVLKLLRTDFHMLFCRWLNMLPFFQPSGFSLETSQQRPLLLLWNPPSTPVPVVEAEPDVIQLPLELRRVWWWLPLSDQILVSALWRKHIQRDDISGLQVKSRMKKWFKKIKNKDGLLK